MVKNILIIEDDPVVSATLVDGLRQRGYEVRSADTGREGLDLAEQLNPDIVLLDVRLPDMSGIKVAQAFKVTRTPFVVISAHDNADSVRRLAKLGALCYLTKPLFVKQLVPILETTSLRSSEVQQLCRSNERLQSVVDNGIVVAMATGVLMERQDTGRQAASAQLQQQAHARRMKVQDYAAELLRVLENPNQDPLEPVN